MNSKIRKDFGPLRLMVVAVLALLSFFLPENNWAAEMNVEGVVVIEGGPCGAQPAGGGACAADDQSGEGVRLVFVSKATGEVVGRARAGEGGRFATQLAPGDYDVRLAAEQGGALRLGGYAARVPATGKASLKVRLQALRP